MGVFVTLAGIAKLLSNGSMAELKIQLIGLIELMLFGKKTYRTTASYYTSKPYYRPTYVARKHLPNPAGNIPSKKEADEILSCIENDINSFGCISERDVAYYLEPFITDTDSYFISLGWKDMGIFSVVPNDIGGYSIAMSEKPTHIDVK